MVVFSSLKKPVAIGMAALALLGDAVSAQFCATPEAIGHRPAVGTYIMNRQSAMEQVMERLGNNAGLMEDTIVYLQGAAMEQTFFADTEKLFRQESNFLYMCQYGLPFSVGVISAECVVTADVNANNQLEVTSWLFVEKPTSNYAVWDGAPYTLEEIARDFEVDKVAWREDMADTLRDFGRSRVMTLPNTDLSKSAAASVLGGLSQTATLKPALDAARTLKNPGEVDLIRVATEVTTGAHNRVMRAGEEYTHEFQVQAMFQGETGMCSQNRQAYLSICGGGERSSILHYNENREPISASNNDIMLIDAGSEGHGYGTDVTRTWPLNGVYGPEQKAIYEAVLYAQDVALHGLTLGASWTQVSRNSSIALVDGLIAAGLVVDDLQGALDNRIDRVFMPHGLGHNIGIDVHDPGYRSPLTEGMVFTVEPGIYMIDALLEPALASPTQSRFLNADVIEQFRRRETSLGGVRIEDMIVMTRDGWDNLSGGSPRTVEDTERFIRTGEFTYDPVKEKEDARLAYERMVEALSRSNAVWPASRMEEQELPPHTHKPRNNNVVFSAY